MTFYTFYLFKEALCFHLTIRLVPCFDLASHDMDT